MVRLFIIASVSSQPPADLYSVFFSDALDANAIESDCNQSSLSEDEISLKIRKHRRKITADIINKVKTEFDFNTSASFPSPFGSADILLDPYPREYETGGVFSYIIDKVEKVICWHALRGRAYILVCDKHENRMLAGQLLIHLIGKLQEYLPAANVLLLEPVNRVEIVSALVNTFLPSGQLLFAHRHVMKHLDKDLHKIISHNL